MDNHGSKSNLQDQFEKEQRVDGSQYKNFRKKYLIYTLTDFERNYQIRTLSKQNNNQIRLYSSNNNSDIDKVKFS
jgi:hypothetical protein